jgi:hypothetical protein
MALPSRNRLLETICISDALLCRYFRTNCTAGARQKAVSDLQSAENTGELGVHDIKVKSAIFPT